MNCLEVCCYGIDLGTSIHHSMVQPITVSGGIWTNESAPLCLVRIPDEEDGSTSELLDMIFAPGEIAVVVVGGVDSSVVSLL